MQSMESVYEWLAFPVFILAFSTFLFFHNRWIEDHAKLLFDSKKDLLQTLISVARVKISRSPSGACHLLEIDVARAEASCELSITRSVVPSALPKTSRARRRSCWQTAARCSSSAPMRKTHGGFGRWTGGCAGGALPRA